MTDGTVQDFGTPAGERRLWNLPSQHLVVALQAMLILTICRASHRYPLITRGIAFHGTYWHNDYGAPRSHGCVNMLPEDAKSIAPWALPAYDDRHTTAPISRQAGTLITVI